MNTETKLENFDDLWGLGNPIVIEKKFRELLPQAMALKDKSIYLQLLSQIALTQALQKKFDDAHGTLNDAEKILTAEHDLARVRILLERGRVFHQAGMVLQQDEEITQAKVLFEQAYELGAKHQFDFHTINAAHMVAIVSEKVEQKIEWNEIAIKLAEKTKDQKAHAWLGSLYNNLGQNFLEAKQFDSALVVLKKTLELRKKEGHAPNIRVAKWAIARTTRFLEQIDEALTLLNALIKEYDEISNNGNLDMPPEMFTMTRGLVYEELAETYNAKARVVSKLAYDDLSKDEMFRKTEPKRLERLKEIQKL